MSRAARMQAANADRAYARALSELGGDFVAITDPFDTRHIRYSCTECGVECGTK